MRQTAYDDEYPKKATLDSEVISTFYNEWLDHKKSESKTIPPKRILMIEDDLDLSAVLRQNLMKRYTCKVDVASDPYEAINLATENFYDLIILDWNLPSLNGGETLMRIEKAMFFEPTLPIQWDGKQVPVVIFSSGLRQECPFRKTKHFNYVGFVSKTQPLDHILETFSGMIERREKI